MALRRASTKPSDPSVAELKRQQAELSRRMRATQRELREAPGRRAREQADRAVTMPPPDDFADRQRERKFYAELSRGQLRNVRRSQAGSVLLFILLVAATIALVMWMLRIVQPMP
jgi:hypothetical protein